MQVSIPDQQVWWWILTVSRPRDTVPMNLVTVMGQGMSRSLRIYPRA